MPDLGFTTGYLQAQQVDQKNQLFKLSMQEGQQDVEAKDLSIQQAKKAIKIQDDVAKAMSAKTNGDGGISGQIAKIDNAAQVALGEGGLVEAENLMNLSSKLATHDAEIKKSQTEQQQQGLDLAGNLLEGVHDKDSRNQAIMDFVRLDEGRDPKVLQMLQNLATKPYDQKEIDALKQGVMTSKERALKLSQEASAKAADVDAQQAPLRAKLLKAQASEANSLAALHNKQGSQIDASKDAAKSEGAIAAAATGMPLNQVAPGYGTQATQERRQLRDGAIALIQKETGMSEKEAGEEYARRSIAFQSGKKSSGQPTTMLGATRQAVGQLDFNVDMTTKEMSKLASSDISPVVNAIARGEEKWTGEPAYSSLFYYLSGAAIEAARIRSGGQASAAQLHQGAAEEAQNWANINMTPASWQEVATAMKLEGRNKIQTYEDAIGGATGDVTNPKGGPGRAPTGLIAVNSKGEKITYDRVQKKWVPYNG